MVGYHYYNDESHTDDLMLSDIFVDNAKYVQLGFTIALISSPGAAFANELPYNVRQFITEVSVNETETCKLAANALAVGACAKMIACGKGVLDATSSTYAAQTAQKAAEETAKKVTPNNLTVAVYLIAIGWCMSGCGLCCSSHFILKVQSDQNLNQILSYLLQILITLNL